MVASDHSADMARRIPNSQLIIYPNSGHGGVFQHHETFLAEAKDILLRADRAVRLARQTNNVAGGVVRARVLAKRLDDAPLAIVDKRRERAGVSEVMNIIGDVKDRFCILIDDIADSAGTLCNAAEALKAAGASDVVAYISHGVLSGQAVERISNSALRKMVITDTIEASAAAEFCDKIRYLPVAPLLGEAIRRIADETSVSSLFD